METGQPVMLAAPTDGAACGQAGTFRHCNLVEIRVGGLEASAVINADRQHAGHRAGKCDDTGGRSRGNRAGRH